MDLIYVVNEITGQVDAELKCKIVQKMIIKPENGKQSTCHSEWHNTIALVVSGHWCKNWSCFKKDMTGQTVT